MKMDQISNFKKSIPDGEQFLQEPLSQYSYWRANAYIGGQNPLTWEGIYHLHGALERRSWNGIKYVLAFLLLAQL
jgi:hypothetical protein